MKSRLIVLYTLVFAIGVLLSGNALALNVQLLRPQTGHVKGFQLYTSDNLEKYHLAIGTAFNYAYQPLERTPGGTVRNGGIVDHLVTQDILFSYGVSDSFSLSLGVPIHLYRDIAPTLIPTRDKGADFGDIMLSAKWSLWNANKTSTGLGLALVPFVTFQTGDENSWVGDSNMTGGVTVAGDWQFGDDNRLFLNLGTRFRESETVLNLTVDHELTYGLGYQRPLSKKRRLDVIGEVFGSTTYDKFATEDISSPLEALLTFRKKWGRGDQWVGQLGGGAAISNGYGLPNFRVTSGLSYAWNLKKKLDKPQIIQVNEKIHFEFDKSIIKPKSYPVIDKVADILKSHKDIATIVIEGHTDSIGSDQYNLNLSQRRADAIKAYLINKGIAAHRLTTKGYGESQPIATNATAEGRALNRRSVFAITHKY